MTWRDAAAYLRENQTNVKYSRIHIIDVNKQRRTYGTSRGGKQAKATIREYTDWNYGKTFEENPINIYRDQYRIVQIRNYINTVRRRRAAVRNQLGLNGTIASILGKWKMRQLGNALKNYKKLLTTTTCNQSGNIKSEYA